MSAVIIILPVVHIGERDAGGWQSQQQRERDEPMRTIRFRACPRLVVDNPHRAREPRRRRRSLPSVFVKQAGH